MRKRPEPLPVTGRNCADDENECAGTGSVCKSRFVLISKVAQPLEITAEMVGRERPSAHQTTATLVTFPSRQTGSTMISRNGVVPMTNDRGFRFDAVGLSPEAARISRLFAQYLPASRLEDLCDGLMFVCGKIKGPRRCRQGPL